MKVETIAKSINEYAHNYDYFWAYGLIKETINLWRKPVNYNLLSNTAKSIVDCYFGG